MNIDQQVTQHNATRRPGEDFAYKCIGCGELHFRAPGRRKVRCFQCGLNRMTENIRQQMTRSGDMYEAAQNRWLAGCVAAAQRMARRDS